MGAGGPSPALAWVCTISPAVSGATVYTTEVPKQPCGAEDKGCIVRDSDMTATVDTAMQVVIRVGATAPACCVLLGAAAIVAATTRLIDLSTAACPIDSDLI